MAEGAGGQTWSAENYAANAYYVPELGGEILSWAAPRSGERILDLGCGDGALTRKLVAAGGVVIGIDASPSMVEAAKADGLDARVGRGEALEFRSEFDLVFSNAALHWMPEADAVAAGVYSALKPGGRFVAEMGGHANVASIVTAMRAAARMFGGDESLASPWYFPSPDEHRRRLVQAGFAVRRIELHPRPTPLPTGIEGWLGVFRKPFFDQYPEPRRAEAIAFVAGLLAPVLADSDGNWIADYVRLRFEAVRP